MSNDDAHAAAAGDASSTLGRPLPANPTVHVTQTYFHHIVDVEKATLQVQVVGGWNVGHTFQHPRIKSTPKLRSKNIANELEKKTVGFLSLARSPSPQAETAAADTILCWAESGDGYGLHGDLVQAGADDLSLSNAIWTRRVLALSRILGLAASKVQKHDRKVWVDGREVVIPGIFEACHVEKKLATHAVFTLLRIFSTPAAGGIRGASLRRRLMALRDARWDDGSRPAFNITFSRKNCHTCARFVNKLSVLTGVPIRLEWHDRLVKIVYIQQRKSNTARAAEERAGPDSDLDGLDDGDEEGEEWPDEEDEKAMDQQDKGWEKQLEKEWKDQLDDQNDAAVDAKPRSPPKTPRNREPPAPPSGLIVKPLPPTPETQPPAFLGTPAVRERSRRPWHASG